MKKQLIIAEKPSVARSIASVLGVTARYDGYLENDTYIVSWCIGHLVGLSQADAYDPKYKKWVHQDLPIIPEKWEYSVSPNTEKQFNILKQLMKDSSVDTIICATDAGREGELIFRLVYDKVRCTKPIKRLWISSMEESAIADGFRHLGDGKDYDNLYQSALCRSKADWLVGINATRLFSVLHDQKLNVGRVMTPTLAMIVERNDTIAKFVSKPIFKVQIDCGEFMATSDRMEDKVKATALTNACDGAVATVISVSKKDKQEKPPKLYDLTTLQRDANRMYGLTASQTLETAQSLYEKKILTYPRTDSRYLTKEMEGNMTPLVHMVAKVLGMTSQPECKLSQVIDSGKVTDHHAIIPTMSLQTFQCSTLSANEQMILKLVSVRLLSAVGSPYRYAETVAVLDCAKTPFTARGKTTITQGFKAVESILRSRNGKGTTAEIILPPMSKGTRFSPVVATLKEGKTVPPKEFTEDTLLSSMETAGIEDMPDDVERKGLGTPATRASIIEKLIKVEFVERRKGGNSKVSHLVPTSKGVALIGITPQTIQSPRLTANWEERLKAVEHGVLSPREFMDDITTMVTELVVTHPNTGETGNFPVFASQKEGIGICPRCGKKVIESPKGFFCEDRNCLFALWKDNRFFSEKKKNLTKTTAVQLLKHGKVKMKGLYSSKTGKTYDAVIVMEDTGGKYVNFRLEFGE